MVAFSRELLQAVLEGRNDIIIYDDTVVHTDENGWTLLHFATFYNNAGVVRQLVSRRAVVDAVDRYGWTPLMVAMSTAGAEDCAETLLQAGANIDATTVDGTSPLQWVWAGNRSARLSRVFIRRARARFADDEQFFAKLIRAGCTAAHVVFTRDSRLLEQLALRGAPLDFVEPEDGLAAIHAAASNADLPMIEVLLRHGADAQALDSEGRCALHHLYCSRAVDEEQQQQRLAILRLLLERNVPADPVGLTHEGESHFARVFTNGCRSSVEMVWDLADRADMDDAGNTALHLMCANSNAGIEEFIVDNAREFDVHAVNAYGESALWWAARHGAVDNVRYLLSQGVDPNVPTRQGYTPLLSIFSVPNLELLPSHHLCVQELLNNNADSQVRVSRSGNLISIIQIADGLGNEELFRLFIQDLARREAAHSGTITHWMRQEISDDADLDALYENNLQRERNLIILGILETCFGIFIAHRIFSFL